jgi:hypothetical protein
VNAAGWLLLVITGFGLGLVIYLVADEVKSRKIRAQRRRVYGYDEDEV